MNANQVSGHVTNPTNTMHKKKFTTESTQYPTIINTPIITFPA
jgi:hypothetical protein